MGTQRGIGTQRGQTKGVLSWLVRWASRAGTRDFCSSLAALVAQNKIFFSSPVHYFSSFVQQAGQAAVLGRLSLIVCLCSEL
jgi:hypothetical protein